MNRAIVFVFTFCFTALLAGCGVPAATIVPTASPTQNPQTPTDTDTPAPTATAYIRPTLPPEWTQPPTDTYAAPTSTPVPLPTWDATGTWLFQQPTQAVCVEFRVDEEQNATAFTSGIDLPIFWTPVAGATGYKITLQDYQQNVVFEDLIGAITTYTIPGEALGVQPFYVWVIRPLDGAGRQICNAIGRLVSFGG